MNAGDGAGCTLEERLECVVVHKVVLACMKKWAMGCGRTELCAVHSNPFV